MKFIKLIITTLLLFTLSSTFAQDAQSLESSQEPKVEETIEHTPESKERYYAYKKHADNLHELDASEEGNEKFVESQEQLLYTSYKIMYKNLNYLKKLGYTEDSNGHFEIWGVSTFYLGAFLILLALGLVIAFVISRFIKFIISLIKRKYKNLFTKILDAIYKPFAAFLYLRSFYSFVFIAYEFDFIMLFQNVFLILFFAVFFWGVISIYDVVANQLKNYADRKSGYREIIPMFTNAIRWILIGCCIIYTIDKLGGDVKGIIYSLGIGGAALAFASKDTIANFFGSLSLIMDAPFKLGDRIKVGDKLDGVVESIGIRSTRIRNLDRTVSILPNSYLANEYIVNVTLWERRKVNIKLGLVYSTSVEQIRNIMANIEQALIADERVDSNSFFVNFEDFADSALVLNIVYFIVNTDFNTYSKALTDLNCKFMEIVEKNNSDFAFPTRTIYTKNI